MAGEKGTEIRDDKLWNELAFGYKNQHHMAVTLFEHTVYLLRIQLDCSSQLRTELTETGCNLAQDVNVWIDLNDDEKFDQSEIGTPYRWPVSSYMGEVDIGDPYLTLSDTVCSQTSGKIVLVIMAGEQGSHIRDDTPKNTGIREDQNRHHMAITLYENTIYRICIQLDCDQRSVRGSFKVSCNLAYDVNVLIDLNNDKIFDESESRVPRRWPIRSTMTIGIYDLEIHIPSINERTMRSDSHLMRVVVKSSDEYTSKCGRTDYSETREYTVNIIPKTTTYGGGNTIF
ncbi:unnamed protein product [Rotaria sordida]|uniref:GEVED domain-containing protein n=2 Tax=Rotaria sordida TaxID=392033 RepID=A0A815L2F2_9BILA|nr:unnamed protein product [Rotaria sordida]